MPEVSKVQKAQPSRAIRAMAMLRFSDVICGGETGQFRANSDSVGWKGISGTVVVQPTGSIRRAEWFEGRLRLLCATEEGAEPEVLALDGFKETDYDPLWKFLGQTCEVHLKKHRPKAALEEADFDAAMRSIEDGADRVDAAKGSVQKKAKEADLMKIVEAIRDGLDLAVSGDKQALSRVFAANGCERIGRLRLVVDTVNLEVYHTDERWKHLLSKCATIEAVLKELGTFRLWKPAEGHSESLLKRAMVKELRHRQGDETEQVTAPKAPTPKAPEPMEAPQAPEAPQARQAPKPIQVQPHPEPEPSAPATPPSAPAKSSAPAAGPLQPRNERGVLTQPPASKSVRKEADAEGSRSPKSRGADADADERARRLHYTHPNSIFEGWVWKRSRFLKLWRRRWVVLLPNQLMSFRNRGDREATELLPAGTIYRVYSADGEVKQPRCFCVAVRQRNYYMVTDDETQKRAWMQEIEKALCKKQGQ